MTRIAGCVAVVLLGIALLALAEGKYSIATAKINPPKELAPPLAKLLSDEAVRLLDDKKKLIAEVWLRREVPVGVPAEQVKGELVYRHFREGTLFAAMRVHQLMRDYRNQQIRPGVYTLRLGFQPLDGDHMGTSPYPEFFLVLLADRDRSPEPLDVKKLREESSRAVKTTHPGVLLLFPSPKPQATPKLVAQEMEHWVLHAQTQAVAGKRKIPAGIGLTLIGHSTE